MDTIEFKIYAEGQAINRDEWVKLYSAIFKEFGKGFGLPQTFLGSRVFEVKLDIFHSTEKIMNDLNGKFDKDRLLTFLLTKLVNEMFKESAKMFRLWCSIPKDVRPEDLAQEFTKFALENVQKMDYVK